MDSKLKTVKYDTPEEIARVWCCPDSDGKVLGLLGKVTVPEFIEEIRENGIWGFFHEENGEVHYWCSEEVSLGSAIRFFGHELGHILGKQDGTILENEYEAEKYANAAHIAAKLAWEAVDFLDCKQAKSTRTTDIEKPVIVFAAIEKAQDEQILEIGIKRKKSSGAIIREAIDKVIDIYLNSQVDEERNEG
jgi:hypothetical protein